jgi:hypothetical protein
MILTPKHLTELIQMKIVLIGFVVGEIFCKSVFLTQRHIQYKEQIMLMNSKFAQTEDSSLLGCDTSLICKYLPTFWRNFLRPF